MSVRSRSRQAGRADSPAAGTAPSEGKRGGAGAPDNAAPSGRLLLRMPRTLHGALTESAEREGTSLNQFITGTLASAIGWNGESQGADGTRLAPRGVENRELETRAAQPSRALLAILFANAVAVGLAALGAVGILLLAWLG